MTDVNEKLDAAYAANQALRDALEPLVQPYVDWVVEASKDERGLSTVVSEDVYAIDDDGLLLAGGGPACELLWSGTFRYSWARGWLYYEPRSADEEVAVDALLDAAREMRS